MSEHHTYRHMSAGYVLGALDTEDRRLFETHLEGCDDCRREVAELAPIPGLLSRVDPTEPEAVPAAVVDLAVASARSSVAGLERSVRRWRVVAVAAAVALVAALAPWLLGSDAGSRGTKLAVASGSVTGDVVVDERVWGTAVRLELAGLPQRDRYVAWVVAADGARQQAATWGPTPAGQAMVEGASSIRTSEVTAIVVTSADGDETIATAVIG